MLLLASLASLGCADGERPPYASVGEGGSAAELPPADDEQGASADLGPLCEGGLDVLLIGNSYTFYNELPTLFAGFAEAAGCGLRLDSSTAPGVALAHHRTDPTTQGLLEAGDWDVVVLQDQSQTPSQPKSVLEAGPLLDAVALSEKAREASPEARVLYYVTWGREQGDAEHCAEQPEVCTFAGHTAALLSGYTLYAERTSGELAPVGLAFQDVTEDGAAPTAARDLWLDDGSHPTLAGSYLAAAVLFATAFEVAPTELEFDGGLSAADARYLREVAERRYIESAGRP